MDNTAVLVIFVAAIFALVAFGAFFVYSRRARVEIRTPVGEMKLDASDETKPGVKIGANVNLTKAEMEDIVGGNRVEGQSNVKPSSDTKGVEIGEGTNLTGAKIKKITGGDSIGE